MDKLIRPEDLRRLLWGAAGVAAAGLLAGAAMQPNLLAPSDVEGQQIQMGVSGPRAYAADDPAASWAGYAGAIPDYVIGTDWLKPPQSGEEPLPEYAYAEDYSAFDDEPYQPAPAAAYEEPPREPTRYPSMIGGTAYSAGETATAAVAVEPVGTSLDPEVTAAPAG